MECRILKSGLKVLFIKVRLPSLKGGHQSDDLTFSPDSWVLPSSSWTLWIRCPKMW